MKTKFEAIFSAGEVVTRTSEHPYLFAVGLRNKETGKLRAVIFTASTTPKPNWSTLVGSCPRYGSQNDRARWQKQIDEEKAKWDVEIVEAKEVSK